MDLQKPFFGLTSQHCVDTVLSGQLDTDCTKQFVANCLSLGVIAGATIVKVPQILRILKSQSVHGVSEAAFIIELLANAIYCCYNVLEGYPISNWGESAFVTIQCILLVLLYWSFQPGHHLIRGSLTCVLAAFFTFVLQGPFPHSALPILGFAPTPISVASRLPQIVRNLRQGHTGELSLLTMGMQAAGNAARVFTTVTQIDDWVVLTGHVTALCLNGTLLLQIVVYWKATHHVNREVAEARANKKGQ
ncbi:unnamed protein product [Vitrella brassicaformis CCMP3155]|uniref:Mannose-P-dolichol utilization defect 1 protein homolog n=2 Tax=Vitrella brassicaformis TaxID=1169539 RepID=A0A0G4E8F1_VITBC|nr:unnamed protein product [Vitrella brassicaformis CCMP3155]|mmetsp:Transcript_24760/g.61182  ORF Transcript_24760/g.61182 Transcript_24760/m.61182 type:complete len:248 (+) Transcript_24760:88-831(+)|eukprot:CEL92013.1 unnamed protein product [Vitrella brassicaformis CCMP3155]